MLQVFFLVTNDQKSKGSKGMLCHGIIDKNIFSLKNLCICLFAFLKCFVNIA